MRKEKKNKLTCKNKEKKKQTYMHFHNFRSSHGIQNQLNVVCQFFNLQNDIFRANTTYYNTILMKV
jgi:hypothetical protein